MGSQCSAGAAALRDDVCDSRCLCSKVASDEDDVPVQLEGMKQRSGVALLPVVFGQDQRVIGVDLHGGPSQRSNVEWYYDLCKGLTGLHATTSCFSIWRENKKTNGYAKVIPTSLRSRSNGDRSVGGGATRVIFFDDNLEWGGLENSSGICNLRDASSGEFVEFWEGVNGFEKDRCARHTVIHRSSAYDCVLVKASILDAMEDKDYFCNIVRKYAEPGEKIIVYMDVNSTIVANDTVQGKGVDQSLLSTMFEFIELRPSAQAGFDFYWDSFPPVRIEKPQSLKTIVKDATASDNAAYNAFFTEERCMQFFQELHNFGDIRWARGGEAMTLDSFQEQYRRYLVAMPNATDKDGITSSWYACFESLRHDHAVMLNSFGVDIRKVVLATVADESRVVQLAVNHELWDERDAKKFALQFSSP